MSEEKRETFEVPVLYVRGAALYTEASPADVEAQPFVRTLITQNAQLGVEYKKLQQKLVELTAQWTKEGAELKNRVIVAERAYEDLVETFSPTEAVGPIGLLEEQLKFEERVKYSDDTLAAANRYYRAAHELTGGSTNSKEIVVATYNAALLLAKAFRLERSASEPK